MQPRYVGRFTFCAPTRAKYVIIYVSQFARVPGCMAVVTSDPLRNITSMFNTLSWSHRLFVSYMFLLLTAFRLSTTCWAGLR